MSATAADLADNRYQNGLEAAVSSSILNARSFCSIELELTIVNSNSIVWLEGFLCFPYVKLPFQGLEKKVPTLGNIWFFR